MSRPVRVFLPCPGLGRVRRGYETFTAECARAVADDPRLDVCVFAGGASPGAVRLRCVARTSPAARPLRGLAGGRGAYVAEQLSFGASLVPWLRRRSPDVVLVSDYHLARLLLRLRAAAGGRLPFRLLFSNGGPVPPELLRPFDHVHQVAPAQRDAAVAAGLPPERQSLIPYGVALPAAPGDRAAARRRLELPAVRPILLSAGVLDVDHKRMDFLVREVARLAPERRPHLVLLGERGAQTPGIERLARQSLGPEGCTVRTVAPEAVGGYYDAADAFALASLAEGFGRVLVEAAGRGLPCVAHDHPVARWILGDTGRLLDLERGGSLAEALPDVLARGRDAAQAATLRRRFGWDALAGDYADLFVRMAATAPQARTTTSGSSGAR